MEFDPEYLEEVERNKPLKYHQDLLIYLSLRGYPAAKSKLILAKQELVISVAVDFLLCGRTFMDLVNLGNNGLLAGVQQLNTFDTGDFDDYLKPYIINAIKEDIPL